MDKTKLRISEIFYSIQGESSRVGWPTVFIRLTGCPLRCHYCDTTYAFKGGERFALDDILEKVQSYPVRYITVTGGEPLAQPQCLKLLTLLCDKGYLVSLETSGALTIEQVDSRVMNIVDLKTPSSGECEKNLYSNLPLLKATDQVKFVVETREDFEWSCDIIKHYDLSSRCELLFSPVWDKLNPGLLADWLLESGVHARLQVQLHKVLWGDATGR
jgi:7-carboxy-7-deazaguanine synthase